METWVLITFGAALFQTARFMLQKQLASAALSATGATFARFVYSAPLVALVLAGVVWTGGQGLPGLGPLFWPYALAGGLAQILATVCVVALFRHRNFAVGITFKKTEVILTVLVGLIVLGEGVSGAGLAAMLVGLAGVLVLSPPPGGPGALWRRIANPAAGLGVLSGLLFAVSGVSYRGASLQVAADPAMRALVTLAAVTMAQMLAMWVWLVWRDPGQVRAVLRAHRMAKWVGLTSMAGSYCWFTAYTLQNAAYVNAVGQVELILSLAAATLFFGEKVSPRELLGIALLSVSVLGLILLG